MRPDIAMCWDGRTKTADLIVDGVAISGKPNDVQHIFNELNRLRDRARAAELALDAVRRTVREAL